MRQIVSFERPSVTLTPFRHFHNAIKTGLESLEGMSNFAIIFNKNSIMEPQKSTGLPLDLAALRRNYAMESLLESSVAAHPADQFEKWMREALAGQLLEPNAMTLATVSDDGQPSARIVLLKEFTREGFVFYTNYDSRKGHDIQTNPKVALLFNWLELERQIRIEGTAVRVSPEVSLNYFKTRPLGSRVGAWASAQSSIVESREALEQQFAAVEAKFKGSEDIPLPPGWGGYLVIPDSIEFWQGRENRMHDRIRYRIDGEAWKIERLAP